MIATVVLACAVAYFPGLSNAQQIIPPGQRYTIAGMRMKCQAASQVVGLSPSEPNYGLMLDWADNCFGFVNGVMSTYHDLGVMTGKPLLCPPEDGTISQDVAIFLKWTDKNPEHWETSASSGLYMALAEAFPCRAKECAP